MIQVNRLILGPAQRADPLWWGNLSQGSVYVQHLGKIFVPIETVNSGNELKFIANKSCSMVFEQPIGLNLINPKTWIFIVPEG
jgi:hypothetical protein